MAVVNAAAYTAALAPESIATAFGSDLAVAGGAGTSVTVQDQAGTVRAANVVQFVTVSNNIVQGSSRVFAGGEGLAQGNGHDISYIHNDVTDGYHAGISVCNLGCPPVGFQAGGTNILSHYRRFPTRTRPSIFLVIEGTVAPQNGAARVSKRSRDALLLRLGNGREQSPLRAAFPGTSPRPFMGNCLRPSES